MSDPTNWSAPPPPPPAPPYASAAPPAPPYPTAPELQDSYEPAPLASLAYSGYSMPVIHGGARPGSLTAVGVISIVVACLTGIACVWAAILLFVFVMMAKVSGAMAPM